jgi:hypothetical protein
LPHRIIGPARKNNAPRPPLSTARPSSEIASTQLRRPALCPPAAAAVQAIPVAAAAFFATRLSFEPVFRSAFFADFLAFDKDPDFFRFFICSSLCRDCAARRLKRSTRDRQKVSRRRSGAQVGLQRRLADLTPVARHLGENGLLGVGRQTHESTANRAVSFSELVRHSLTKGGSTEARSALSLHMKQDPKFVDRTGVNPARCRARLGVFLDSRFPTRAGDI